MNQYYTYRLTIANKATVQIQKQDPQGKDLGQPAGKLQYRGKLLRQLKPLVLKGQDGTLTAVDIQTLGEALFTTLFDQQLLIDFATFYNQYVHSNQTNYLRLELDIDEKSLPDLAALPWEFMRLPQKANLGSLWLGTAPRLSFSRRRAQWVAPDPIGLRQDEKLKIALVVANPSQLAPVAYETVWQKLQEIAANNPQKLELLPLVESATPQSISEVLKARPHILHFIGHGRLQDEDGNEVEELALVDATNLWVKADYFSELFNEHRPGVVLLQACESAALSASRAFVGVASRVVQQNIPVVVAMQHKVSNSTATRFACHFYERIACEEAVDVAAQNGRRHLSLDLALQYKTRDFATPVIFMRVANGHLFTRKPALVNVKPPASVELADSLRITLGQLNYQPQRDGFETFLYHSHKATNCHIGALAISGSSATAGQRWLLNRFTELLPASQQDKEIVRLDMDKAIQSLGVDFLWDELAKRTAPITDKPTDIAAAIRTDLHEKHFLFIFENAQALYPGYIEKMMIDFWQPLTAAVMPPPLPDHWLVLFLLDNQGKLANHLLTLSQRPLWPTHSLTALPPLKESFDREDLGKWLASHKQENLLQPLQPRLNTWEKREMLLDEIMQESGNGNPIPVFMKLCDLCGQNWSQVRGKLLKL